MMKDRIVPPTTIKIPCPKLSEQSNGNDKNNVTVDWFLSHICSDRSGYAHPVWIYDWTDGFYPDDEGKLSAELIAVFQSDFVPSFTFNQEICRMVVKEIYWTEKGIVLTVYGASAE